MTRMRNWYRLMAVALFVALATQPGYSKEESIENDTYQNLTRAEASLIAYWPLQDNLRDVEAEADGRMNEGQPSFVDGLEAERSLSLAGNRSLFVKNAPEMNSEEMTVELWFYADFAPGTKGNPCLIANRSDSGTDGIWSVHLWSDYSQIAIWNGRQVARYQPVNGPLQKNRWYGLTISNSKEGQSVYLDGVQCKRVSSAAARFSQTAPGLPLLMGVATPQGKEAFSGRIAHVALYNAAIPADRVAARVDAMGWKERRLAVVANLKEEQSRAEKVRADAKAERQTELARLMTDEKLYPPDESRTFSGKYLTAVDIPVGALGGSVIRMNGKAEREWWHIFNNFEERAGTGKVPNSFFAIRAKSAAGTVLRALQTSELGPFQGMQSLSFSSEFPFGLYKFSDDGLPVDVELEAYSFLIPMDLKNSAIPAAVFRYTITNTKAEDVEVDILATQQNAVGYTGYDKITGPNQRNCAGYGSNQNRIVAEDGRTSLQMTGDAGSMVLSVYDTDAVTYSAAWASLAGLRGDFAADGRLDGDEQASSPKEGETVDGALAAGAVLKPGEKRTVTFVLSWHIPKASYGKKGVSGWYWPEGGNQYENWWTDAAAVDQYVADHFQDLDGNTRLYRDALYSSNLPRYVIDRVSSNISVLKAPTSFWTKNGYFGIWESTSNREQWYGNVTHVLHYAQGHARLFPELDRMLSKQDLNSMRKDGMLPDRQGSPRPNNAMDGHFGVILAAYRAHLLSADAGFIQNTWPSVKKAMEYAIRTHDPDQDGMLSGTYHNTLDCNSSGTSPWIGSLYLAALKASAEMARIAEDTDAAGVYAAIFEKGRINQNQKLWDEKLGYYTPVNEGAPGTRIMGDAVSIDMFLGQWWANQLDLGRIYPVERTRKALLEIFKTNRFTDTTGSYRAHFRDFLGKGDTGWQMFVHPGRVPGNTIYYYDEVMSGFEYGMAATLIQHGLVEEGLTVIRTIHDRYDGRLRAKGEVHMANNSTVFGTGSPVGEDECGDYYARALSSWSALLALQGFVYDGPGGVIGFKPVWKPENHSSFFTAADGWGMFTQRIEEGRQTERIDLKYGKLTLRELVFARAADAVPEQVVLKVGNRPAAVTTATDGTELTITLEQPITLEAGETLTVQIR